MSNGNFGAGIIGFILGILTFGLYGVFKRRQQSRIGYTEVVYDNSNATTVTRVEQPRK